MRSRLLFDNNRWQPVLRKKVPSDQLTAIAHAAVGTCNKRLTSSRQPPQPPRLFKPRNACFTTCEALLPTPQSLRGAVFPALPKTISESSSQSRSRTRPRKTQAGERNPEGFCGSDIGEAIGVLFEYVPRL